MAAKSKQAGERAGAAQQAATDAGGKPADDAQQAATDAGGKPADDAQQAATDAGSKAGGAGDQADGMFSELKDTAVEAALAILKPAVKSAAESATNYAVSKGPNLVKDQVDQVGSKLGDAGGIGELANKALSNAGPAGKVASKLGMGGKLVDNVLPGGDGDDEDGGEAEADATGSGRRMPVQQSMDVAVPLEVAYNQWTQFEEYPNFMHRVDSASQDDDAHVTFTEKVWGFGRDFEAEIVEQRPNERIVWRSVNGLKHAGVVTFHQLADRLTRIEVTVDFKPESLFQKFARGTRFSKRAIRADLHRFKAYIEMTEEEEGAWLGVIEGGEVVKDHEQAEQERQAEAEADESEEEEQPEAEGEESEEEEPEAEEEEEPEADEEEQPEAEEEEEPEADEEEQPEAEEEEQPEAEEAPAPRRRRAPSDNGGRKRAQRSRPSAQQKRSGGQRRSPKSPSTPRRRTAKSSSR